MSLSQQSHQLTHALTDHFGVTAHAHEIGITVPTRYHVHVQMAGQTSTCASACIDACVKTVRIDSLCKAGLDVTCLFHEIEHFLVCGVRQIRKVTFGCNKHMTIVVGIPIHHHQTKFRTPEYKIVIILFRMCVTVTQKTPLNLLAC